MTDKPHFRMTASGDVLPAIRAQDGFRNVVANLGTDRDKAAANGYFNTTVARDQLVAAYRTSAVARNIVDMPAEDACREWRAWQAEEDQISALEAEEQRLGLQKLTMEAKRRARLHGGAAIFIGTGDSDPSQPLNPERITTGGLKYLTLLDRWELTADRIQRDPRLPGFGRPVMYRMQAGEGGLVDIHPSRLAVFSGAEVPDSTYRDAQQGWGDSELNATMDKIEHLDATIANVASLVFEAKVDVISIPRFAEDLRTGGTAYEQAVVSRFALVARAKGINGTVILDAEEEYNQKTANFSTLPDIIDRFMQIVSAASCIPMTRLFGTSPAGLNSTGEGDMRTYYDRIRQEQTLEMQPALYVLDECLIRSALGARPDEVHYNWRSLWQISEKDRAEIADKLASAAEKMARVDVPPEVVADALVNALTESGAFPGLEGKMAEYVAGAPRREDVDTDPLTGEPLEI